MKVLIILGSPRKNGNSETLAQTLTNELSEKVPITAQYLRLTEFTIAPCIGCGGCEKTGMCIVKDDMIDFYATIDEADIIFLASPVYFYGPSAQLKAFIDRCQALWSRKYLLKKRVRQNEKRGGYLLSVGATSGKKLFDASILIAKSFFDAIDVPYCESFTVRGVDEKGAIDSSDALMAESCQFASQIAQKMQNE